MNMEDGKNVCKCMENFHCPASCYNYIQLISSECSEGCSSGNDQLLQSVLKSTFSSLRSSYRIFNLICMCDRFERK